MSPYVGEFVGTLLLLLMGNGVVGGVVLKGTKSENAGWVVIAIAWGLSVAFAIYAVGNYSGAHINPAVTLGLASVGEFPWGKAPGYILAQMGGAFCGALLVWVHYLPHWEKTEDKGAKLSVFCTGPAIRSSMANLVSEILGTFVLVGGILFIGANKFTEGLNPLVIGGLITLIGFSFGGTTGFAINPARDLGPRIAHFLLPVAGKGKSDWQYSWIPVVGPAIGGMLGALVYKAVFTKTLFPLFWVIVIITLAVIIMAVIKYTNKSKGPDV